jgi:exodeoxyribonuclease VII small subunit
VKPASEREPTFERALEKLETLLSGMESGDVPLAELIERFEEGNRLLAVCSRRLRDAEQKIELLKQEREGVSFENFDPEKP